MGILLGLNNFSTRNGAGNVFSKRSIVNTSFREDNTSFREDPKLESVIKIAMVN